MKTISPTIYARAFRKTLKEKNAALEDLIRNLGAIVNEHCTSRQSVQVVRRVSEEIVHHAGGKWVVIETARDAGDSMQKKIKKAFRDVDYIEQRVRPELVSGVRIVVDGEKEFDGSLKRKLDTLF